MIADCAEKQRCVSPPKKVFVRDAQVDDPGEVSHLQLQKQELILQEAFRCSGQKARLVPGVRCSQGPHTAERILARFVAPATGTSCRKASSRLRPGYEARFHSIPGFPLPACGRRFRGHPEPGPGRFQLVLFLHRLPGAWMSWR